MKTQLIISFLFLISLNSIAQDTVWICHEWHPIPGKVYLQDCSEGFCIDFENNYNPIIIDSTTNYQWQIGTTTKFELGPQYWNRSIITDSINPYPINYLSSFRITVVGNFSAYPFELFFQHQYETDKGKDGGKIEIYNKFNDKWENIVKTLNLNSFNLYTESDSIAALNNEPGFSGTSNGHESVSIYFEPSLGEAMDTFDIKFVFASDSIDNNKDGWIIDDICLYGIYEGISDKEGMFFKIFPNPFNDNIIIQNLNDLYIYDSYIEIIDIKGNLVYSIADYDGSELNLSELNSGLYLMKIVSGRNCYVQKVLKK